MAIGDAATAAGLSILTGAEDIRNGYIEINRTRDYLASVYKKSHVEWTANSGSIASGGSASTGTMTYQSGQSNVSTTALATISTNTLSIVADGLYSLTCYGTIGTAPTGETAMIVTDGTFTFRVLALQGTGSGIWGGSLVSDWRWPAGTVLTFSFLHTSAASRTLVSRWALTKTGNY